MQNNSDYYLKYLKYKNKYIDLKKKSMKGGASSSYVFGMLDDIDKLSDADAKFWYDVFIKIIELIEKQMYSVSGRMVASSTDNKVKFECIHHFFSFIIFEFIRDGKTKEKIMSYYNSEPYNWSRKSNVSEPIYNDYNNIHHWAQLLLNYRSIDRSEFRLPEDEFITKQSTCLDNAVIVGDHKQTLKNLFWCLLNIPDPKVNVKTQVKTKVNENEN